MLRRVRGIFASTVGPRRGPVGGVVDTNHLDIVQQEEVFARAAGMCEGDIAPGQLHHPSLLTRAGATLGLDVEEPQQPSLEQSRVASIEAEVVRLPPPILSLRRDRAVASPYPCSLPWFWSAATISTTSTDNRSSGCTGPPHTPQPAQSSRPDSPSPRPSDPLSFSFLNSSPDMIMDLGHDQSEAVVKPAPSPSPSRRVSKHPSPDDNEDEEVKPAFKRSKTEEDKNGESPVLSAVITEMMQHKRKSPESDKDESEDSSRPSKRVKSSTAEEKPTEEPHTPRLKPSLQPREDISSLQSTPYSKRKRKSPHTPDSDEEYVASSEQETLTPPRKKARKSKGQDDGLVTFHDAGADASEDGDVVIPQAERNELVYELTREKAQRLAEAVQIPEDTHLGREERDLFLNMATRGCKPLIPGHWRKDFPTLPVSLFTTDGDKNNCQNADQDLLFEAHKNSDFSALRALQDFLKISGHVRDCQLLEIQPEMVIQKAINKYLRWAINDADLKTGPATSPLHAVYTQQKDETTLAAVSKLARKLERLAKRHLASLGGPRANNYWPMLVGFLACGPIVAIISLDTNPKSKVWVENLEVKVNYLGQFDVSEEEQDVWNSFAVAISVLHVRKCMAQLVASDLAPSAPRFRGLNEETDDEDL
ncbi:hypothetical protein NUU61_003990 [Penicillium alfredii]|uniref:Uncharacterized protein n=1 Tax=Penicillium alfredii TaxID=1506179 RepID=A0A9W9FK96_9EURO|nr:uncharacterized protein NUU61_003990 [Penicillium alfredii]KAJ5101768.1 hypothetical protein NUU61_003990 [Penicillium alfredii]